MSDYEIDEIRHIRHRISTAHGHDLGRIAEHYRAMEAELRKSGRYRFADERVFFLFPSSKLGNTVPEAPASRREVPRLELGRQYQDTPPKHRRASRKQESP
uniref:Uncharacterized protein n=1 Tax=Candidatus Kentrum sp. FM TaxID=2126340 RepID=A0A450TSD8_9GAMM|nr:MAG: hypothetical protein BECKFM1743A_GA0114220_105785 [Candidatus Kentron sp. FM]VFJ71524.1 MAG: hypothetical protein BECKFM1743C_GA0114222_106005 [Candidatus Kentron sp. FM]VFK18936.1 MAG: hypothetical protein BECKFM1743B_GA0114221_105846 [Candidatus Kentron sp. FM]